MTSQPPIARRHETANTIHGHRLADDYAWLREKDSPEVIAFLEQENAYTRAVMKPTEELQAKLSVSDPAQRTAFTDYQAHVNAGTKSGKFDEAQLKADYAAIDAVRRGEEDREVEALNGLHALLTPEQREKEERMRAHTAAKKSH